MYLDDILTEVITRLHLRIDDELDEIFNDMRGDLLIEEARSFHKSALVPKTSYRYIFEILKGKLMLFFLKDGTVWCTVGTLNCCSNRIESFYKNRGQISRTYIVGHILHFNGYIILSKRKYDPFKW
jgi:hypothetical protein